MTDLLPRPEICWADAAIISNYEAATLPLLYAPEEDCKQYFQAMKRKNPRKGLGLEAVFALCLEARSDKDNGNFMGTLRKLLDGAERRAQLFHTGDYQVVAAYEHCVWTAVHLGVLELSSTKTSTACAASTLFSFGSDVLRTCRRAQSPLLSGFVSSVLEFALNYNWSCYFAHRCKWHAAAHHASLAEHKWSRIAAAGAPSQLSDFITLRRLMLEERLGESLSNVRNELQQLQLRRDVVADYRDVQERSTEPAPSLFAIQVTAGDECRELTVCLSAARPQNSWDTPLSEAISFLTAYTLAMCDQSLKHYNEAQKRLQDLVSSPPRGNPSWENNVVLLQRLCVSKESAAAVIARTVQPMPLEMTRSSGLRVQRLLKNYIVSQRFRKQRLRAEQVRRQHLIDEGGDEENDPEFDSKWRIPPTASEAKGLLTVASRQNASVAAFASMFPLLQNRTSVREALKVLEASNTSIVSPAAALGEPICTHRGSPNFATRPATVEPLMAAEVAECNAPRRSALTPPPTNKTSSISERTKGIYGVDARHVHVPHSMPVLTSGTEHCRKPTTPSQVDRVAMLSEVAQEFVVMEAENAINNQSHSCRSSADVMRRFAASLMAMADVLTAKANVIDVAHAAGEHASSTFMTVAVDEGTPAERPCPVKHADVALSPVAAAPELEIAANNTRLAVSSNEPPSTEDMETLRRKQQHLRALLPTIDHHCTAYRMVVHELAENESVMQHQRNAVKVAKLARDAEMGAARRSSVSFNQKSMIVSSNSKASGGPMSQPVLVGAADAAETSDSCRKQELHAIGWWLGLSFLPLPPVDNDGDEAV